MKKTVAIFVLVFSLGMTFVAAVHAQATPASDETYYDRVTHKLGRGFSNLIFSPIEIARSLDYKMDQHGFGGGVFIGLIHGLGRMVGRIGTSVLDIVSFPVAPHPDLNYWMEPEFVFSNA